MDRAAAKLAFKPYHSVSVPKSVDLQTAATCGGCEPGNRTTVMLRNIPNRYCQAQLLDEIDQAGFVGTYDFFYLPMDTHNRTNVGYAFINFSTPPSMDEFITSFSGYRFKDHSSQKIAKVSPAHLQGFYENVQHFSNRAVTHSRNSQYRPVVIIDGQRLDLNDAVEQLFLSQYAYQYGDHGSAAAFDPSIDGMCFDVGQEDLVPSFITAEGSECMLGHDPYAEMNWQAEALVVDHLLYETSADPAWPHLPGGVPDLASVDVASSPPGLSPWPVQQVVPGFDADAATVPTAEQIQQAASLFSLDKTGLEQALSQLLGGAGEAATSTEGDSPRTQSCSASQCSGSPLPEGGETTEAGGIGVWDLPAVAEPGLCRHRAHCSE